MSKTQLFSKLRHHEIAKMTTMVSDDGLRDTKSSNYMIEYEKYVVFMVLSNVGIASAHLVK